METRVAKLALFQHEPYCSRDCCAGITAALGDVHDITIIGLKDLSLACLMRFDLVIFPGGRGEASQFQNLLHRHIQTLHDYMDQGGRYLGICMGAYWADAYYFNLLKNIRCAQYITRPKAEIRRSYPTLARIRWEGQTERMYFFDGCTFWGDVSDTQIIATYGNGDPMAILQGAVGLIGCHPESEAHWYHSKILNTAWHEYRHHGLLLNFVNKMLAYKPAQPALSATDLTPVESALKTIIDLTQPFTRGTYQQVNLIARSALRQSRKSP